MSVHNHNHADDEAEAMINQVSHQLVGDLDAENKRLRAHVAALREACEAALGRRNEWAKDPKVGICAGTAEYVIEPIRAALEATK